MENLNNAKEKIITLIHKECTKLSNLEAFQLLQEVIEDCQNEADTCLQMEYMEDLGDGEEV